MKTFPVLTSALCLLALTSSGFAQTGGDAAEPGDPDAGVEAASLSPELRMNTAFTTYGFEYLGSYGDMVSPQDSLRLVMVAKQRAIAQLCDGFEVDEARYTAVMNPIILPLMEAGSPSGDSEGPMVNLPFTIAMSGYSIFLGGSLAVGAYDLDATCAFGAELRAELAEEGGEQLRIWKDVD
jgi:hypothetical protein